MTAADVLVVGGGIAGASVAYELAGAARVLLIERENVPGYHSTGRSAAIFSETYGHPSLIALACASRAFFERPPDGFTDTPLLRPRGVVLPGRAEDKAELDHLFTRYGDVVAGLRPLDGAELAVLLPILRPMWRACALFEPGAMDLDVHALHTGYLRGLRARGGQVMTDVGLGALVRAGGGWRAETSAGPIEAAAVVNAAGAWADEVAGLAGLAPLGLAAMRRTVLTFPAPEGVDPTPWPMTVAADESFYLRPEGGTILASPADETPVPPSDVQPEEIDVAIAIDRIERATTLTVPRVLSRWAGLRTFAPDRAPVLGKDPRTAGFFWLAGQGGSGIMAAPAMARAVAAWTLGRDLPPDISARNLSLDEIGPARLI